MSLIIIRVMWVKYKVNKYECIPCKSALTLSLADPLDPTRISSIEISFLEKPHEMTYFQQAINTYPEIVLVGRSEGFYFTLNEIKIYSQETKNFIFVSQIVIVKEQIKKNEIEKSKKIAKEKLYKNAHQQVSKFTHLLKQKDRKLLQLKIMYDEASYYKEQALKLPEIERQFKKALLKYETQLKKAQQNYDQASFTLTSKNQRINVLEKQLASYKDHNRISQLQKQLKNIQLRFDQVSEQLHKERQKIIEIQETRKKPMWRKSIRQDPQYFRFIEEENRYYQEQMERKRKQIKDLKNEITLLKAGGANRPINIRT